MAKVTDEDMEVFRELFKPVEGHRRERVYEHDDIVTPFEAAWILKHEDFDD